MSTPSTAGSCGEIPEGPTGTDAVHAGVRPDKSHGAVLTPVVISTTYAQESVENYLKNGYSYSRCGNPTVSALEEKIGILEGGFTACCFATGMAATITALCSILQQGDHMVLTQCSYGGTNRAARILLRNKFGVNVSFADFTNLASIRAAIIPGKTKLLFSETPCNPGLELQDVREISNLAQEFSSATDQKAEEQLEEGEGPSRRCLQNKVFHICDSTLSTPFVVQPLRLGADIVIQSVTKFYDGHNMNVGGAVICRSKEVADLVRFYQNVLGNIMSPQVAFSILQTIKTMKLRVNHQSSSAFRIARFLEGHEKVEFVRYPGLASHPQHQTARKQHMNDLYGSMVTFEVKGGSQAGIKFMNSVQHPWTLAENLGAAESICTCPAVFTHANMTREDRLKVGISDGLIRLSVGLEEPDDLIKALDAALKVL